MNNADFYKAFGIVTDSNNRLEGSQPFLRKEVINSPFGQQSYSQVQYSYGTEVANTEQSTVQQPLYTY